MDGSEEAAGPRQHHAGQPHACSRARRLPWTAAGAGAGRGVLHRASLTLSDITAGHGDAVIIPGSLLRALGSHAFSVAIFT